MAGLTAQGLVIRTPAEILARLEAALRGAFPGIDLSEGPEQQIIGVLAEELGLAWEIIQALDGSQGRAAAGLALDQIAALTGSRRRVATRSTVPATVTLAAGATLPAGSVAAVEGNPDAQFRTTTAVTNGSGVQAPVAAVLESVQTGVVAAPAGTLTVIVTARTGWISITNATDAELGQVEAGDVELRAARERELAGAGLTSYAALRAAVSEIDEVLQVVVRGNETLVTDADGRPAKSFEVIVWAGSPAPSGIRNLVAPAVLAKKPVGIAAYGIGSGTATDPDSGQSVSVGVTVATALRLYVELEVVLSGTEGSEWQTQVKAALVARAAQYTIGSRVYSSQLIAAVLDDVAGVVAVTSLTVGTSASPVTQSVTPTSRQMPTLASADITITEAP